ncbi:hypothetical protein, partial [Acinetobacter baumannii]
AGQRSVKSGAVDSAGSDAGVTKRIMAYLLKYLFLHTVLFKIFPVLQGEFFLFLPGYCSGR